MKKEKTYEVPKLKAGDRIRVDVMVRNRAIETTKFTVFEKDNELYYNNVFDHKLSEISPTNRIIKIS